jgi:hypothetical protein
MLRSAIGGVSVRKVKSNELGPSWEVNSWSSIQEILKHFMESEDSWACLQNPSPILYPEPGESLLPF